MLQMCAKETIAFSLEGFLISICNQPVLMEAFDGF